LPLHQDQKRPARYPRDIGTTLGITERSVFGIVTGLTAAGYVVNDKETADRSHQRQVHRLRGISVHTPQVSGCQQAVSGGNRGICDTPVMRGQQRGHDPGGDHGGSCTCRIASRGTMPAASSSPADHVIGHLVDLAGEPGMERPGLLAALGQVADPRRRRGVRHRLVVIMVLAGGRSYAAIAE
jgi:hypothetical protein